MHACTYDQHKRVCHTISRPKSGIQSTPPTYFLGFQKTWGGYIPRGQVEYFSEISGLTPPKDSKVKGG